MKPEANQNTKMKTEITVIFRNLKAVTFGSNTEARDAIAKKAKCDPRDIYIDGFGPEGMGVQFWVAGRRLRNPIARSNRF
jgi:hypothetical protein